MTTDPDLLRAEAFEEVGRIVERDASILVELWCECALEQQPDAERVHHETLRDHLPPLLRALGQALADVQPNGHILDYLADKHGAERWQAGWSLSEVVNDYRLMRLVLMDHLEQELGRPLFSREVMALGLGLDEAIAASVEMYQKHCEEDSRRQERRRIDALADADRRKDEFLATLAHELRNPLAPILNALEILRLPNVPHAVCVESVDVADRQLRHIVRLVDDLLDISRISQGKVVLHKEVIDIAQAVRCAIESVRPLMRSFDHQFEIALPAEPLLVEVDPGRFEQVLINLLNNAAKYTESGGNIRLTITRHDGQALIRVTDNGIGIEPELLPRIFNLFVQSNDAEGRARGGLGIGLALVKRLTELLGGSVSVSSEGAGKGSQFTVRLPIHEQADTGATSHSTGQPQPERVRVLLVDDNSDVVNTLAMLLRRVGHDVLVAQNGEEALRIALAEVPAVIVLDIGLPGRDGYSVAQEMRQRPELAHCRLVAMTGYGQEEDVQRARQAGFDFHLLKPVRLEAIQQVLSRTATPGDLS